jgi:hypothetical protein
MRRMTFSLAGRFESGESLPPPIQRGIGRCTGSGLMPASGMVWYAVWKVAAGFVQRARGTSNE